MFFKMHNKQEQINVILIMSPQAHHNFQLSILNSKLNAPNALKCFGAMLIYEYKFNIRHCISLFSYRGTGYPYPHHRLFREYDRRHSPAR